MKQKSIALGWSTFFSTFLTILLVTTANAQGTAPVDQVAVALRAYGPGGPAPAMRESAWAGDPSYDAWLIWTIWQKENPVAADLIPTEPELTIYRSCGVAITNRSKRKALAKEFADFLQSAEGQEIFLKWGWMKP